MATKPVLPSGKQVCRITGTLACPEIMKPDLSAFIPLIIRIDSGRVAVYPEGLQWTLTQTKTLDRNSDLYGRCFAQFIVMELRAYLSYRQKDLMLSFWRSTHGHEVDFLLGDEIAIEVKSTRKAISDDLKGLKALKEEKKFEKYYLVCQEPKTRTVDGIEIINWQSFLKKLWDDEITEGP